MADLAESPPLSIDVLRRIESVCTRFEEAASPEDRDIGAILADVSGDERRVLLCELVALDVELRRDRGEQPSASEYLCHLDSPNDNSQVVARIHELVDGVPASDDSLPRSARYEFLEQVGSGGVSTVWRVFDSHGRRPLAIKLLHKRFRKDASA